MSIEDSKERMARGITLFAEGLIGYIGNLPTAMAIPVPQMVTRYGAENDLSTCTLVEAAKMIGMSRSTIDRLCDGGKIEYIQNPNSKYRRILTSSLRRWVEKQHHPIQEKRTGKDNSQNKTKERQH